jgi:hypothetical protein
MDLITLASIALVLLLAVAIVRSPWVQAKLRGRRPSAAPVVEPLREVVAGFLPDLSRPEPLARTQADYGRMKVKLLRESIDYANQQLADQAEYEREMLMAVHLMNERDKKEAELAARRVASAQTNIAPNTQLPTGATL